MIEIAEEDPSGLAELLANLIGQNLERDPSRRRLVRPTVATVRALDADVVVTLRLERDRVVVTEGASPGAHLRIHADAGSLLELAAVPLRLGLPDPLSREGRRVALDLLSGRLRVRGLLRHPIRLARLTRLLSVDR
jgi:hypothetical protein